MSVNGSGRPEHSEHQADDAEQADRCRRLARATYDRTTAQMLERMAVNYDKRASEREG
ncbi:MAG: hypothetical protein ABIS38_07590 [Sphingomicrobium sp.]